MTTIAITTNRFQTYASFIKLEHTIFSLPLIIAGMLLHTRAIPSIRLLLLIIMAAIFGRVMAMGLNRIIDANIDARNPRTKMRELPRGAMQRIEAWMIVYISGLLYLTAAWAIAPICIWLSPIPVVLFIVYPYLKRFTVLSHLGLGLAWSMAPLGGYLAASHSLEHLSGILWLWVFSFFWVTGFDIIYATMDEAFDRDEGLFSLPARIGRNKALGVAVLLHALAFLALTALWKENLSTYASLAWLMCAGAIFIWQHIVAGRRPEFAFFKLNGAIGFVVLGLVISGL